MHSSSEFYSLLGTEIMRTKEKLILTMQLWNIFPLLVLLSDTISSDVLRVKWSTWNQKIDFCLVKAAKNHTLETTAGLSAGAFTVLCSAWAKTEIWEYLNGDKPWKSQHLQLGVLQGPGREKHVLVLYSKSLTLTYSFPVLRNLKDLCEAVLHV